VCGSGGPEEHEKQSLCHMVVSREAAPGKGCCTRHASARLRLLKKLCSLVPSNLGTGSDTASAMAVTLQTSLTVSALGGRSA